MSLAYTLDVTELKNVKSLSQAIINSADIDLGFFELQGLFRFYDVTGQCQQIFPTGEYIIRGGIFMNGMYIYIGSYKAYIKDLFGVGSHGYAWDGFVMVMRGYSINQDDGFNILGEGGTPDPSNFGFLPMRMPIEVNCGPVGSAAAIAADSSVGLHGIDIYKAIDDVQVDSLDRAIKIITCGFQRIDATVEGVPTGSDYVGNLYLAELLSFENVLNTTPQGSKFAQYRSDLPFRVMQNTWKATQAGHADKTNVIARFGFLRDLDQAIAGGEPMVPLPYTYGEWRDGQLPDGTNPGGGPTSLTDRRAITYNYFPRRFLDVSCISQTAISATEEAGSCFFIAGDMALDTNNDGTIDDTCPVAIGGVFEWPGAWQRMLNGDVPYSYLPPFLICHAAIKTSLAITTSWFREGAAPTYTFSGAVAALVSPPYERIAGFSNQPLTTFAVNDVSHSGTDYGHIYVTSDSPVTPTAEFFPYATQGGAFTTASGISMPTKWYNKAIQERTFSISEEDISKVGTTNTETGVFTPTADSVFDEDSEEYIGYQSNYQRYGLTTDPDASGVGILQGTPSRNGYGFLGFKTGVGPIAVMFDSGAPTQTITGGGNSEETGIALAEGANINANILISPNSTTRRIVNAGWDNDRDQWLFISSDSGGSGVISVAANFTTASNNLGFLDQTSNFANNSLLPLPTTANAGLYIPYLMSNALDGFICFGEWDDDSNSRFGIKPILGASEVASNTCGGVTISYTRYASTSYFYRISGTTGRTARVWVDYVLFDGADSVIAKKLKEFGMKVNIENVEWFKRKIIRGGDLNIKSEEIEMWMREQQSEYKEMLKQKERMGRIRKKKSQVSAFSDGIDEQINPDFMDDEVKDFLGSYTPETRPPTPEEKRQKKKRQGGYEESTDSYYDDAF